MKVLGFLTALTVSLGLVGVFNAQGKQIDPSEVVLKQKEPVYYVKLTKTARIHRVPSLLRQTTVSILQKGEILPVWQVVSSPYGVFYRVGKDLYVHYSVAKVVPWL